MNLVRPQSLILKANLLVIILPHLTPVSLYITETLTVPPNLTTMVTIGFGIVADITNPIVTMVARFGGVVRVSVIQRLTSVR